MVELQQLRGRHAAARLRRLREEEGKGDATHMRESSVRLVRYCSDGARAVAPSDLKSFAL